jgi:hypothetical protein
MSKKVNYILPSAIVLGLLFSCGDSNTGKEIDEDLKDPNKTLITNFDNKVFSIPSPIQTSMLIKQLDLPFYPSVLNSVDKVSSYSTKASQSLNLGVYGTDLGYVSLYNENTYSIKYLAAVQKLTEKLGLTGAFDKKFLSRFDGQLSNQDTLMSLVSDAFKKADMFLKNANRKSDAALILAGGWIESMYLSSEINIQKSNPRIIERIGEQQWTLVSIIDLLSEYNEAGVNDDLIRDLKDLQFYFDKIEFKYTYNEPTTDVEKKTTMLNHKLEIKIDTDILNQISMKIRSIREKITN